MVKGVIYHCYASAHTSLVTAAIHTGLLPATRVATKKEITGLSSFDRVPDSQIGSPHFFGCDLSGYQVMALGMGGGTELVRRALYSWLTIHNLPINSLMLVNLMPHIHPLTRIGGFMSRRLGIVIPGRWLTVRGIQCKYRHYLKLVREVKFRLAASFP